MLMVRLGKRSLRLEKRAHGEVWSLLIEAQGGVFLLNGSVLDRVAAFFSLFLYTSLMTCNDSVCTRMTATAVVTLLHFSAFIQEIG